MKRLFAPLIRALLIKHPDGLTSYELAEMLNTDERSVHRTLHKTFGLYIDRWVHVRAKKSMVYRAVWCMADVPAHCPRPTKK